MAPPANGIRFNGTVYRNWPALAKALRKAGQNPASWISKRPVAAKRLNVRVAPGGKVVSRTGYRRNKADRLVPADAEGDAEIVEEYKGEADLLEELWFHFEEQLAEYEESGGDPLDLASDIFSRVKVKEDNAELIIGDIIGDEKLKDVFYPGMKELETAGVFTNVGINLVAEYYNWRTNVKEAWRSSFGTEMDEGDVTEWMRQGLSAGFVSNYFGWADQVQQSYLRRGMAADQGVLWKEFQGGKSAEQIERELIGADWVAANRGDVQAVSGAFRFGTGNDGTSQRGGGVLTEEQLKALGEQQAGLSSTLGASIETQFEKAMARMQRAFSGGVAQGQVAMPVNRTNPQSRVDVGA